MLSPPLPRRSGRRASSWPGYWTATRLTDDAVLCLSELATNATIHSRSREPGGHFRVRAEVHGSRVRVEVSDQGGPWERSAKEDEQNGRGLLVVAQLARNFGRTGDDQAGWTVWFECG